ncbi:nuclease, partial [Escherichia coli]|nr:nuclease [Escherichia coli]
MTLLKKLLLPTLIVLFPAAVLAGQSSFEAKVVKIIDGDTITALDG